MDADQLTLRKMTVEGITDEDDWLLMWRGLNIGRILTQSGVTMGLPNWLWEITNSGDVRARRPKRRGNRGLAPAGRGSLHDDLLKNGASKSGCSTAE